MAEERTWTDEQRLAIDTRDRTLLISAAAGSGKTATLTERIIRSLLDEKNPENINEILIVTFTKAAVAELRERIGKAVRAALANDPDNERLRRQLALLPGAKIQTIDSFCVDILRKNCDKVGVSPSFRIPDEAEARLIALSTVERLIDQVYDGLLPEVATPEQFEELSDGLTDTRETGELSTVLLKLYGNLINEEEGVDVLFALGEQYNVKAAEDIGRSGVMAYAIERLHGMARHYSKLYKRALAELNPDTDKTGAHTAMCLSEIEYLARIEATSDYAALYTLVCETERSAKTTRRGASDVGRFVVSVREELDDDLSYYKEKIFFMNVRSLLALLDGLYRRVGTLHRVLSYFDRAFMQEKRRLAICEFSDVARYAYKCLWDGAPTETAKSEAERYSSIYIDEYQDVNGIQNRIFEAISRPHNRFMVGDIKQSIYGFRGARPEIFAGMKKSFPELPLSKAGGSASIFMSKNFRSESPIIDFVNEIFDSLFELAGDSIGYSRGDRLECGKKQLRREPFPEIHILPKTSAATDPEREPRFVAELIGRLTTEGVSVDGRPIAPSDVAVLLRSDVGRVADFAEAMSSSGIPVKVPDSANFFFNAEILLATSLLCAVDNPRRDIYLAALMRSPLFDFSLDELLTLRHSSDAETLYDALLEYCKENPEYTRGTEFIASLEHYRRIAEGLPVDEVIARLYRETGLLATASAGARANLDLLYEYARSFEASSFKGLYNFIRYLNNVINREMRLDEKQEATAEGAVRIITAHKSKGLEFPVVIMADTAKNMSRRDSGRLFYADGFAVSMTVRTESGLAVLENPVNNIIADYNAALDFEEELRVLYVALTRAKERLYVVGTSPNVKIADFDEKIEFFKQTLSPYSVYKLPSFLASILATSSVCARVVRHDPTDDEPETEDTEQPETEEVSECEPTLAASEIEARFDYEYPDLYLTTLPRKMSVSYLYPAVLDGAEEQIYGITDADREEQPVKRQRSGTRPRFLSEKDSRESAKRGVATHLFMQFCDLDNFASVGAQAELERLVREKFISAEDAARVRLDEIELFRSSGLLARMREAKRIYRELRFNVRFPASHFTEDEKRREAYSHETVLVQGVIDCIVEDDGGELMLVDYKTDRLTSEELSDREKATEKLTRSHATQLSYYKMAVERMFGRAPETVAVYSLPLGDTVEINTDKM